jgi:hypothetical protein
MALVSCPDCDKQISDTAPTCLNCGRVMGGVATQAAPAVPPITISQVTAPTSAFACPKCGSEGTKKLSAIWREGLQVTDNVTKGVGLAGGGLGVGVARTSGTAQSVTSIASAPPEKRKYIALVLAALLFGMLGLAVLLSSVMGGLTIVAMAAGMIYVGKQRMDYNKNEFPGELHRWENSYRCGRCENVFALNS